MEKALYYEEKSLVELTPGLGGIPPRIFVYICKIYNKYR
jgi:hypothetical protein